MTRYRARWETTVTWLERRRNAWLVLGAAIALYAAVAMYLTRGTTLFVDEQRLFVESRGLDPQTLLTPLNGHLVLLTRIVYGAGFDLIGPNFVVFRLVEMVGVALSVGVLFEVLSRRVSNALALPAAVLVLFLGSAWEVTLIVSGYTNVFCVAFGLAGILALEKHGRAWNAAACVLLVAAAGTWSLGVAIVLGVGVWLLLDPRGRRLLWVPAVPLALYAAWFIAVLLGAIPDNGGTDSLHASNLLLFANFFANELSSVAGAVAGVNYDFSPSGVLPQFTTTSPFGQVLALLIAWALVARIRRSGLSPQFWGMLAALMLFWLGLTLATGQGRDPSVVRYVYPGAVLGFVIAAEALRGLPISRVTVLLVVAAATLALGANLIRLRDGAHYFRDFSTTLRAKLAAIELARDEVDPGFTISSGLQLDVAGPYLAAVDRNGSPGYSASELTAQPEPVRAAADSTLVAALGLQLETASSAPASCAAPAQTDPSGTLEVQAPSRVVISLSSPGTVAVRRFALATTVPLGSVTPGARAELTLPRDAYDGPWFVQVSSSGSVRVC